METIDFVPLVKAYPALSRTYGEVSCIAGVELTPKGPRWIRLYPVPFRALSDTQQFAKYQPMRVRVESHRGDRRPETRRPDQDSIELLGDPIPSDDAWRQRRPFVEPLMAESMCAIRRAQATDGTSLGVFRPREVHDLEIEPANIKAGKREIAQAWAAQGSLLDRLEDGEEAAQVKALELIPWTFKLRYDCAEPTCPGHTQSVIDWEIAMTYQRVQRSADWREKVRARWLNTLCGPQRDTAFFVGNQHQFPTSFLILGIWWPERRPEQLTFDTSDAWPPAR